MASLKTTITGNLGAMHAAEGEKFFKRKIKNDGEATMGSPFLPMNKVQLAQTGAQIGTLPKGDNTTGGVVGGLSDKGTYHGKKAGRS